MAIIKLGSTIVGIRGTIGGLTFSENAGGPYAKLWTRGRRKQSNPVTQNRGIWSQWAQAWRSLSSAQRSGWDTYAAAAPQQLTNSLGINYFASGFNWFVRINQHLASLGRGQRDTAPTASRPAAPSLSSLTITSPGTSSNSVTFPASEFDGFDGLWTLQLGIGAGSAVPSDRSFLIVEAVQSYTTEASQDLGDLTVFFGDIPQDRRVWLRGYRQDDQGQRSAAAQLLTEVV